MNVQEANHETIVAQALSLGLDLNGESTQEIQAMIDRFANHHDAVDAQISARSRIPDPTPPVLSPCAEASALILQAGELLKQATLIYAQHGPAWKVKALRRLRERLAVGSTRADESPE